MCQSDYVPLFDQLSESCTYVRGAVPVHIAGVGTAVGFVPVSFACPMHPLVLPCHARLCILATQTKNGVDFLNVRENKLAKFFNSGEVGYWKVERRPIPGAPKRKIPLLNEAMDVLVLDIPEQGDRKNLIVSYEVRCAGGSCD